MCLCLLESTREDLCVDDAENKAICIVLAVVVRRVLSLLSFL